MKDHPYDTCYIETGCWQILDLLWAGRPFELALRPIPCQVAMEEGRLPLEMAILKLAQWRTGAEVGLMQFCLMTGASWPFDSGDLSISSCKMSFDKL